MSNHRIDIAKQLAIIETELDRIQEKSQVEGLDLDDTRRFDMLVKCKEMLMGNPTTISKSIKHADVTDDELMETLTKPVLKKIK